MAQMVLRAYASNFFKTAFSSFKKPRLSLKPIVFGSARCFQTGEDTGFWDIEGSIAVTPSQTGNKKNNPSEGVRTLSANKTGNFDSDLVRVTKFGHIRIDSENIAEEPAEAPAITDPAESSNYIDEQFFRRGNVSNLTEKDQSFVKASEIPTDTNEIDTQYFYSFEDQVGETLKATNKADPESVPSDLKFEKDTIDEQYFGKPAFDTTSKGKQISALEHLQFSTNQTKTFRNDFDEEVKDSQKSYSKLIPDFRKLPVDVICSILKKSIIYNEGGIVAINKPFGMVTTDVDKLAKLILTDFLPTLSQLLRYEKLYTVHRLDRDTTGVLILASNQEMANKLNKLFLGKEIKKVYVAITKGVPDPKEGTINIPISETTVMNRQRMKLRPVQPYSDTQSDSYNYKGKSSKAVTHYKLYPPLAALSDVFLQIYQEFLRKPKRIVKILLYSLAILSVFLSNLENSSGSNCYSYQVIRFKGSSALVQLEPETGVRHQIRVHLSEAIQCPILGDHKYSHHDKYAPQKLPGDLLRNLNIPPTKTRTIPMHLHAKSIHIPNMGLDGKELIITAPFPQYFRHTLKKLKLSFKNM